MNLLRELPLYREPTSDCQTGCNTHGADAPAADSQDGARRLPRLLKREVPKGNFNHLTQGLLDELKLKVKGDNLLLLANQCIYQQKLLLNKKQAINKLVGGELRNE